MYTFRNLINDAYAKSGVVGIGMTVSSQQLSEGLSTVNEILDELYATNEYGATTSHPVTFTGASSYTMGPAGEETPDIDLGVVPSNIDKVIITVGGVRIPLGYITPLDFFSRSLDEISSDVPDAFTVERTFPLATLRFFEGKPTGPGELIFSPSLVDVTASTDFKHFPREIKPYLVYEAAARIAELNAFEANTLRQRAINALSKYKQASYQGQSYVADGSAPGMCGNNKYNIYAGD